MNLFRRIAALLAAVVAAATLNAGSAAAIDNVPCGNRDDLMKIWLHMSGGSPEPYCFANGGEYHLWGLGWWVTKIWTGNNRVQWYGDGRWQPAQPIGKWTTFRWPNHPGGVRVEGFRIL